MRYFPVSSTLKMFQRISLTFVDTRPVAITKCFCFNLEIRRPLATTPNTSKKILSPPQMRDYSDDIRNRIDRIVKNTKEILMTINLGEMRSAPTNYFWFNMLGAAAFFAPPMLSMIGGYSPLLTGLELGYGAAYLSFLGGMKWMHYASSEDVAWDNVGQSIVPPVVAITGLILPTVLAYPVIIVGTLATLYMDIISNIYPPWGNALRLFVTTVAVISMFLMLIGHILFG